MKEMTETTGNALIDRLYTEPIESPKKKEQNFFRCADLSFSTQGGGNGTQKKGI